MINRDSEIRKVAFIGDYLPRKCGIATFTHDLYSSVASQYPATECFVVPVNDTPQGYDYPREARFEFDEKDLDSYLRAAEFLNFSNADVVCLQHEYGIFGGPAGGHILGLVNDLRVPVVTTLHTVLRAPSADQHRVLSRLCDLSARVVVMTERGRNFLREIYDVPESKIDLIAHGIPDTQFIDPIFFKDQLGVAGKQVILTCGLLSPNKGIEHMLRALPAILEQFPNLVYVVLGATHPHLVRAHGESYRQGLERLARELGIRKNVSFHNRFVELEELTEFIGAADIYVTPYLNPAQITSGTLAYSFGCGKAVVSTPYWHAEELLADGRGVLVPFSDPDALAREIIELLRDDPRRHAMRKKAYLLGREMVWPYVARLYMESFQRARRNRAECLCKPQVNGVLEEPQTELPAWRLDHLASMTDSTGMFQHACFTIPNFAEGYCTDDNARALLLTTMLEELRQDSPEVHRLATTYAAFLNMAYDSELGRFRNFMGFDRRWLELVGSPDSHGRAVWALGACVGRSRSRSLQSWAARIFDPALSVVTEFTAPRAWAFSLLGIGEYFRRLSGDRVAARVRDTLTTRLVELYEQTAGEDWLWFEDAVTYDNARLPHALIVSARSSGNEKALQVGLESLRWLVALQTAPQGHFRAIGSNGFHQRGREHPVQFDQQPLEAAATVSACLAAFRTTNDPAWLLDARVAFEWFLGRNDLGLPLYDPGTGGCRDGLQQDRTNHNEGAESTLAFLLSLAEMQLIEDIQAAFEQPTEVNSLDYNYLA